MIDLSQPQGHIKDIIANLKAGMWTLAGSRRSLKYIRPSFAQFVIFALLAIVSNSIFGWIDTSGQGTFNQQGLLNYLLWPFMALVFGLFIAGRRGSVQLILVPVTMWLSADIWVSSFQSVVQLLWHQHWLPGWLYVPIGILFYLLFLWQTIGLMWIFSKVFHWPLWEQGVFLASSFLVLWVWQHNSIKEPMWKLPPAEQTSTVDMPFFPDSIIYAQARLLEDELSQLQPSANLVDNSTPAGLGLTTDDTIATNTAATWYWLGIAGVGTQDVFKNEVVHLRSAFDQQLGFYGQSAMLINEQNSLASYPIATQTSIDRMLNKFGKQMDTNDDVLILYLTSHGTTNELELSNPPFSINNIDPIWLREALDRSRIKWRIIVVSACYSGSFINALQSPTTIVITASRKDRTSFGCTTARDFTYFGKALYDAIEILTNKPNSTAANKSLILQWFESARSTVHQLELTENKTPSLPQITIGSEISQQLTRLEQGLVKQAHFINPNQMSAVDLFSQQ